MAPPIETPTKSSGSHCSSHPPLNERILSSWTRRSVAADPWHDLEIVVPQLICLLLWTYCSQSGVLVNGPPISGVDRNMAHWACERNERMETASSKCTAIGPCSLNSDLLAHCIL
ncbi:hypothetical protein PTKIN_Ptkin14bG0125800 [Pterospermum kingtungense]